MIKKLDKWCDTNWIIFLCVTGTIAITLAAAFWDEIPLGTKAGVFAAIIMPFHVMEEWKCPGGLHYFYNTVFASKSKTKHDLHRYPMSRLTDMVTNVGLQWIPLIYGALCFVTELSNAAALCMIVLCVCEVLAHTGGGILTYVWYRDKGKKTIYHTGFATSYMMFLPMGVYLITQIETVTANDWKWCAILFVIMMLICIPLSETPLKKWVLKQEEGMFAFEDHKYYERFVDYD